MKPVVLWAALTASVILYSLFSKEPSGPLVTGTLLLVAVGLIGVICRKGA